MVMDKWEGNDQWKEIARGYHGHQGEVRTEEPVEYNIWGQAVVRVKSMRSDLPMDVREDNSVLLLIKLPNVK